MKLIATGCLLTGALVIASAQSVNPIAPKKGAYALDFMASYSKPQDADATTSFSINPLFFVTDNIAIGVPITWQHQSGFDQSTIGAEGRFYFASMGNSQLKPFVGASYAVGHTTGDPSITTWGLEGGAHYFVANNVAVTGTVNWAQNRQAGVNENGFSINFGFTIFFAGSH